MSAETENKEELRGEERFALSSCTKLPVTVTREDGESDEAGTAVDISFSGAKIELNSSVAPKSEIEVVINGGQESQKAQVCWSRPAPSGAWWVGCRFEEKLPLELIEGLAEDGFLDRRQDQRRLMSVDGKARFELDAEERPVRLINMSKGGFSLLSPTDPGGSQRLMFTVGGRRGARPTTITAKVVWAKEVADGYQLGCQYGTRDAFQRLHKSLLLPNKSILARWRPNQDRSRTAILVAIFVITLSLWLISSK